jgi:hypothetical protein
MSTTIKKEVEVEVELEYSEICEAVSDLDKQEKRSLIQDCELLTDQNVIDYIDNLDSEEKLKIAEKCDLMDNDVIESHISNLSEDEVKDLLENAGHEDLLKGGSSMSENDEILLNIVKKRLTRKDIERVVKNNDMATLIKALIGILED